MEQQVRLQARPVVHAVLLVSLSVLVAVVWVPDWWSITPVDETQSLNFSAQRAVQNTHPNDAAGWGPSGLMTGLGIGYIIHLLSIWNRRAVLPQSIGTFSMLAPWIVGGLAFLAFNTIPPIQDGIQIEFHWPYQVFRLALVTYFAVLLYWSASAFRTYLRS